LSDFDPSPLWELPAGYMTPAEISDEESASKPGWAGFGSRQDVVDLSFIGGAAHVDSDEYRSQAVKDIENELLVLVGNDMQELNTIKTRLSLHNHSTTQQLASKLRKLALDQNAAVDVPIEVDPSPRPTKRRATCEA